MLFRSRDLQRRKARGRRGLALIEGVRLVEEALAAGVAFKGALVAPDLARTARGTALVAELQGHAVAVEAVGARVFAQLADTETPQGIIAIIEPRRWNATPAASASSTRRTPSMRARPRRPRALRRWRSRIVDCRLLAMGLLEHSRPRPSFQYAKKRGTGAT